AAAAVTGSDLNILAQSEVGLARGRTYWSRRSSAEKVGYAGKSPIPQAPPRHRKLLRTRTGSCTESSSPSIQPLLISLAGAPRGPGGAVLQSPSTYHDAEYDQVEAPSPAGSYMRPFFTKSFRYARDARPGLAWVSPFRDRTDPHCHTETFHSVGSEAVNNSFSLIGFI
ncbi:hypothetical protein VaNZ11_010588, partial [Volvox africanus]